MDSTLIQLNSAPTVADQEAAAAQAQDTAFKQQADQEAAAAKTQDEAFKQQADREATWADLSNRLDTQAPEDIAKDHTLRPPDLLSEFREHLNPSQIAKLSKVYRAMSDAPMTKGDLWEAAKKAPEGLANWGKGTYLFLKSLLGAGDNPTRDRAQAQSAYELGNVQLGETLHNFLDRAGQSEPQPGAWAPRGPVGSNETYAQINRRTSPLSDKATTPEQADIDRLFFAAGLKDQKDQILQGKGEFAKLTGLDADSLAGQDVQWDPKAVAAMAPGADPMNAFFMLGGALSVAKAATGGFQILNKAGQVVAKSATREAAEGLVQKITGAVEKGANATGKLADKVIDLKKGVGGVLIGAASHNPLVMKAAAGALATKVVAAGVEKAAQIAGNPAVYNPLLDVVGAGVKGGATGAALSVPFAEGTPLPQDRADVMAAGTALGVAGGIAGHGFNKGVEAVAPKAQAIANRMKQVALSTYYDKAPELAPVQDVSLDLNPDREKMHAELLDQVKQADPRAANLLNRLRASMFAENGTPSYLVTPEEAEAIHPDLKGKEGVASVNVDGKKTMLWVLGEDGLKSLTHEPGHFVDNFILTPEEQAHLNEVNKPIQKAFDDHYLSQSGLTEEQRTYLQQRPHLLQNELRAEQLGSILDGVDFSGSEHQDWLQNGMGVLVKAMERLGIHKPEVNEGGAGTTPMGFERSHQADKFGKEIINRWLNDPKIREAMGALESNAGQEPTITGLDGKPIEKETPAPGLATPIPDELKSNVQAPPSGAEPGAQPGLATAIPEELKTQDQSLFGRRPMVGPETQPPVREQKPAEAAPVQPNVPAQEQPEVQNLRGKSEKDYTKFQGESRNPANQRVEEAKAAVDASKDLSDDQKKAAQTLLSNLRTPHDVVYNSAKNDAGAQGMERQFRRNKINDARTNPELRGVASKLASIPLDARATKSGDVQLQFWSGDKVLGNLDALLAQPEAHPLIPYEIKEGKLTDKGSNELGQDLRAYTANQDNGFRGDGQKLNRPQNPAGFIPDENPDYTPVKLSKEKTNFLNLLMGEDPPETARMNAGTVPIQARAKTLAALNDHAGIEIKPRKTYKAPFENVAISDYNPLRVQMQEAGVNTSKLTEAHEWVNAKEIKSATPRPDIKLSPTSTDVTAAGFMPAAEAGADRSQVKQAKNPNLTEGFTTNTPGEFLNREEAFNRALEMSQYHPEAHEDASLESQAFARQQEKPLVDEPGMQFTPNENGEPAKLTEDLLAQFMPAKDVDLKDYLDRRVFVLTTDRMGIGHMEVGPHGAKQPMEIAGQGGRGFIHIFRGGGWAFSDESAANRFLTRVREIAGKFDSAIAALAVLSPHNHLKSPTGQLAYYKAMKAAVDSGAVSQKIADAHISEIFNRANTSEDKSMTEDMHKLFSRIKTLDQFGEVARNKEMNFGAAKFWLEKAEQIKLPIHAREAAKLGIGIPDIARDTSDPGLVGMPNYSLVGLVEIPKDQTPHESDFHFSYPWAVDGKAIGFMKGEHNVANLTSDKGIYQPGAKGTRMIGAQPLQVVMPHLDRMEQLALAFMPAKDAPVAEKSLADGLRKKVRNARIVSVDDAVRTLGDYPQYLDGVVNFLANRREALKNGEITKRDLAKAYAITVASQGADSVKLSTLQKALPDFKPDSSFLTADGQKIRPEEAAAWWLGTENGQRALNNLEAGKFDSADWDEFAKVRKVFGDDRIFYSGMMLKPGESAERPIYETDPSSRAVLRDENGNTKPTGKVRKISMGEEENSMANLDAVLEKINAAKGDGDKLMEAVQNLRGIGPAKAPFISHILGFGGELTLDAVEMNYWLTGKGNIKRATPKAKEFVDAVKHDEGSQAILKDRILKRFQEVREASPAAAAIPEDVFNHVMHHWLWDRAKGSETTHEGVYKAALQFMPGKTKTGTFSADDIRPINVTGSGHLVVPVARRQNN